MKKLISFSVFATVVVLLLVVKNTDAQDRSRRVPDGQNRSPRTEPGVQDHSQRIHPRARLHGKMYQPRAHGRLNDKQGIKVRQGWHRKPHHNKMRMHARSQRHLGQYR